MRIGLLEKQRQGKFDGLVIKICGLGISMRSV